MLEDKKPQLTPISELGEFGLIKHLTENFPIKNSSTERSIGDDAAIINPEGKKVVITSDVLAEGVHFNLGYVPLKHLGYPSDRRYSLWTSPHTGRTIIYAATNGSYFR
jgi:thiamine-monophosphate kinase